MPDVVAIKADWGLWPVTDVTLVTLDPPIVTSVTSVAELIGEFHFWGPVKFCVRSPPVSGLESFPSMSDNDSR